MRKDRILALADLIEKQPHTSRDGAPGFCMEAYVHSCGTPSCIAGWASWLSFRKPKTLSGGETDLFDRAKSYLRLDSATAYRLFLPPGYFDPHLYTPAQSAATLRRLAETGEVNWSVSQESNHDPL
jgi:hypothetical protein